MTKTLVQYLRTSIISKESFEESSKHLTKNKLQKSDLALNLTNLCNKLRSKILKIC